MKFNAVFTGLTLLGGALAAPAPSESAKPSSTVSVGTATTLSTVTATGTSGPKPKKYPSINFTPADSPPLVPLYNSTGADPEVVKALKTIPFPRTLLSTLAHAEGLFVPLMGILGHSFDGKVRILPITDWFTIVLRVACRLDAQYVFDNNVFGMEVVGVPQPKINSFNMTAADVRDGLGPWTGRERLLLRIVDEQIDLGRTNRVSTINEALQILEVPELVEALIMCGTYQLFAGVVKGLRVAQDSSMPGLEKVVRRIITSNYVIAPQEVGQKRI